MVAYSAASPKTPASDATGFRTSPNVANELAVPRSMGGGRAKAVGDGREFLEYGLCSRCGLAGTFTDCLDNGIVSTMADSSTALFAKQTFSNGVWQGLWRACCPNESLGATRQSAPLGILVILDVCRRLLLANPPIHLLCRMCDGEKVTVGEGA